MKRLNIPYPIGLSVSKYEGDKNYTITGNLAEKYRIRDFDGAYDFEEYIKKHVDCEGIISIPSTVNSLLTLNRRRGQRSLPRI